MTRQRVSPGSVAIEEGALPSCYRSRPLSWKAYGLEVSLVTQCTSHEGFLILLIHHVELAPYYNFRFSGGATVAPGIVIFHCQSAIFGEQVHDEDSYLIYQIPWYAFCVHLCPYKADVNVFSHGKCTLMVTACQKILRSTKCTAYIVTFSECGRYPPWPILLLIPVPLDIRGFYPRTGNLCIPRKPTQGCIF